MLLPTLLLSGTWCGLVLGGNPDGCYWNRGCKYQLFASKTPYDAVRGDLREAPVIEGCAAVSVWGLLRHGNRRPGDAVTSRLLQALRLRESVLRSHAAGRGQLCAQDIEDLRKFTWDQTIDNTTNYLTDEGYQELLGIGQRLRSRYPHLVNSTDPGDYYFRPTREQRTVASAAAFVQGLLEGSPDVTVDGPWDRDDVIRPYSECERYQRLVKEGPELVHQLDLYEGSAAVRALRDAVQTRLGITEQLTVTEVISFYEFCRFFRTWRADRQSAWCAVFADEDLALMEYHDDVRHYYRNGYGSWVNEKLGQMPLQDLYRSFEAAAAGAGRCITGYFTHDTMLEMAFSALGEFREDQMDPEYMDPDRPWRTSYIAPFATNFIGVLNRCGNSTEDLRVQLFINEKPTSLCPAAGCSWERFQELFARFNSSSLDFCSMNYSGKEISSAGSLAPRAIAFLAFAVLFR